MSHSFRDGDKVSAANEGVMTEDKTLDKTPVRFIAKILEILVNENDFLYWTRSKYHDIPFR